MVLVKKIKHEMSMLRRRHKIDALIDLYEECKDGILEIEEADEIQPSYFSEETKLQKEMDQELRDLLKFKETELETLKSQIKNMKKLESNFVKLKNDFETINKISQEKDKKINQLENKIKKAQALKQETKTEDN